ncbi:TPA: hypothetical protein HA351_10155 [Methanosarcinaceae archaeon]|nr:hypothetical protein [Methanosarcinaceae archaeon]
MWIIEILSSFISLLFSLMKIVCNAGESGSELIKIFPSLVNLLIAAISLVIPLGILFLITSYFGFLNEMLGLLKK